MCKCCHARLLVALLVASCLAQLQGAAAPAGMREEHEGIEFVWATPGAGVVKGVLMLLHGCSHGATDFFPPSPSCPDCLGLPEEVGIVRAALERGLAVLAVSSRDRPPLPHAHHARATPLPAHRDRQHRRCWAVPHSPEHHTVDTQSVMRVLAKLRSDHSDWAEKPLFVLGASSGGAFALALPHYLPIAGVCSQIMALPTGWLRRFLTAEGRASSPPVVFAHMSRDSRTAQRVADAVQLRKELGLASQVIEVTPQPVSAGFLASRVPELAGQAAGAQQVVEALAARGLIDRAGLLLEDPRHTDWRGAVRASGLAGVSDWQLAPDASALSEVLNVAWAGHELMSDPAGPTLDWLLGHAQP